MTVDRFALSGHDSHNAHASTTTPRSEEAMKRLLFVLFAAPAVCALASCTVNKTEHEDGLGRGSDFGLHVDEVEIDD
jgi:hypothetical protein